MKILDPYGFKEKLGMKPSEFTDTRDGKVYKTVIINGVEWFRENLDYDDTEDHGGKMFIDLFLDKLPSLKPDFKKSNCGTLYTFDSAKMACPEGWEIPDRGIFIDLFKKITNLPPNEWRTSERAKIYHALKPILGIEFCGKFDKRSFAKGIDFMGEGLQEYYLTSTPGSMSNGGSIFIFRKDSTDYAEDVGYGYYSVRPIRKNI